MLLLCQSQKTKHMFTEKGTMYLYCLMLVNNVFILFNVSCMIYNVSCMIYKVVQLIIFL